MVTIEMHLKYYEEEARLVKSVAPECLTIRLNEKQVDLIARKLSRHFKFRMPEIIIWGERDEHGFGAKAIGSRTFIRVPRNVTLATVLHELGHVYDINKNKKEKEYLNGSYYKYHTKKLMRAVIRFAKYCRKKDYWRIGYALSSASSSPDGATLTADVTVYKPTLCTPAS